VEACPEEVFQELHQKHPHHVHLKNPDACTGCKKCVRVCEYDAIEYTYLPKSRSNQLPLP
jgi:NAD-dependent dihydropyrimidine dehydrogenase PreA subunit